MKDILQGQEKLIVWIANIVNPVIAGALFYYMWKNSFPNKAKAANKISFIVFGIEFVPFLLYSLVTIHN